MCHSNGILVGDPIWPERGAYVRQCFLSEREGAHLPWWGVPPSDRKAGGWIPLYRGLAAGTVFGPVHKVDDTLDDGGVYQCASSSTSVYGTPRGTENCEAYLFRSCVDQHLHQQARGSGSEASLLHGCGRGRGQCVEASGLEGRLDREGADADCYFVEHNAACAKLC